MEKKYEYKFWCTNLSDGGFNNSDKPLGALLKDGWKPLREVVVDNLGNVLFVLSRQVPDGV
jgi:hypothetical protein